MKTHVFSLTVNGEAPMPTSIPTAVPLDFLRGRAATHEREQGLRPGCQWSLYGANRPAVRLAG